MKQWNRGNNKIIRSDTKLPPYSYLEGLFPICVNCMVLNQGNFGKENSFSVRNEIRTTEI